jgi:hypothetical protein
MFLVGLRLPFPGIALEGLLSFWLSPASNLKFFILGYINGLEITRIMTNGGSAVIGCLNLSPKIFFCMFLRVGPNQIAPNGWRYLLASCILWKKILKTKMDVAQFFKTYSPSTKKEGVVEFQVR